MGLEWIVGGRRSGLNSSQDRGNNRRLRPGAYGGMIERMGV